MDNDYPHMIYKNGRLSDRFENYRIVADAEQELAAAADGFVRYDPEQPDGVPEKRKPGRPAKAEEPGAPVAPVPGADLAAANADAAAELVAMQAAEQTPQQ